MECNTGDVLEFQFLGPLSIRSGKSSLHLSGNHNRALFAALIIDANSAVSIDRLIDVVWGEQPPITARQQIQNRLGKLRSFLMHSGSEARIVRDGSTYTFEVPDECVDGLRFRRLCMEAQVARRNQELERAAGLFRNGLKLWRGAVVQDIDAPALRADVIRWDEARLKAIEAIVDTEFARNRKVEAIPDLHCWVNTYPYHEGLHCRLAEALYEASRTAESLNILSDLRSRLKDELGIGPGNAVSQLEQQILGEGKNIGGTFLPLQLDTRSAEALRHALTETTKALSLLTTALTRP